MRSLARFGRWFLSLLLCGLFGCPDEGVEMSVDVRTDLVAGAEYASIRVTVDGDAIDGPTLGNTMSGRVAEFVGLAPTDTRRVRVAALDGFGREVVGRDAVVVNRQDIAITLTLTRDCRGIACGDSLACLGARCVDASCITGLEESCPEPSCGAPSDCAELDECSDRRCADGVCLYASLDTCAVGSYCSPEDGCVSEGDAGVDAGPDAGPDTAVGDTGSGDTGGDVDEDDAPMSGVEPPVLVWPTNGLRTGSALADPSRSVRFVWEPVDGAIEYRLELDESCVAVNPAECDFVEATVLEVVGTVHRHTLSPFEDEIPRGRRAAWRVRSCDALGCGEPSTARYLDAGRLGYDFDGDGIDTLVVGAEDGLFHYVDGLEAPPREIPSPFLGGARFGVRSAVGDVDGDGFSDLVVGVPGALGGGSLLLFRGSESGLGAGVRLPAPSGLSEYGTGLCMGDFDADGLADVAASGAEGFVTIEFMGGMRFTSSRLPGVVRDCADVDRDGFADVMIDGQWYAGGVGGIFATPRESSATIAHELGDLLGDGYPVFVADNGSRRVLSTFRRADDDPFGMSSSTRIAGHSAVDYQRAARADYNVDGTEDGVAGGRGQAVLVEDVRSSPIVVSALSVEPCDACNAGAALTGGLDLNGDGASDLAVGAPAGSQVFVYMGSEEGLQEPVVLSAPVRASSFGISL